MLFAMSDELLVKQGDDLTIDIKCKTTTWSYDLRLITYDWKNNFNHEYKNLGNH